MAKKPTVTTVTSGYYGRTVLNNNFTALRDAFDNTLSLDGSTPNAMAADLDMDSNDVLNVGLIEASDITIAGSGVNGVLTTATTKATEAAASAVAASASADAAAISAATAGASTSKTALEVGAAADGTTDTTTDIKSGMVPANTAVTFDADTDYVFEGLLLRGAIYEGFFKTGIVDPNSRTSEWDTATQEYFDSESRLWRLKFRHEGISQLLPMPICGDLTQLAKAIWEGAATITFIGTSITEGVDAEAEPANIWVNRMYQRLRDAFPNVTWTLKNLGLGSRRIDYYVDGSYVALASEPADKATGFFREAGIDTWPDGSTLGDSWKQHAEDTAPDCLVVGFGMNSTQALHLYQADLDTIVTESRAWATPPSIVFVTEMSSHQVNDANPEQVKAHSRLTRWAARDKGISLVDAGRWFQWLRAGEDERRFVTRRLNSIETEWVSGGAAPDSRSDTSLVESSATAALIFKRGRYAGLHYRGTFTPDNGTTSFLYVAANISSGGAFTDGILCRRTTTTFVVFDRAGNTIVSKTGLTAMATGVDEAWEIRITENRIQAWFDGVSVCDETIANEGYFGDVMLGVREGSLTAVETDVVIPLPLGIPVMDDDALLGRLTQGAGWDIGDYEDGGNSINHPSRNALAYAFDGAIAEWSDDAVAKLDRGATFLDIGSTDISATTIAFADTDLSITVNCPRYCRVKVRAVVPYVNPSANLVDGVVRIRVDGGVAQLRPMLQSDDGYVAHLEYEGTLTQGSHTIKVDWSCGSSSQTITSNATTLVGLDRTLLVEVY